MIVLPLLDHKHAIGPSMRIGFPPLLPLLPSIRQSALASKRNQRNWSQIKNAKITTIITTTTAAEWTQIKSSKSHLLVLISRLSKWSAKWENNTKQEPVPERGWGGEWGTDKNCFDLLPMLLPLEPEVRRVLATMPQEDAATATAAKLSRTYPAGRRKNEEEGVGRLSLSCHCYDCCNTLWRGDYNVWLLCY